MLVDTHAHLWWDTYKSDVEKVLERAKNAGVEKIIVPGTDLESSEKAVKLAAKYPGFIYAAVGIHPEEIVNHQSPITREQTIRKLRKIIQNYEQYVVAVGEVGTDKSSEALRQGLKEQHEWFEGQCKVALEFDLPLIIHTRESLGETMEVLDSLPKMPQGQFHCFAYGESELAEVLRRGFYLSFCGNITWSKRLQKLAPLVPENKLLSETDSPFMTPVDWRGQKFGEINEPANVKIGIVVQAKLRFMKAEELGNIMADNAKSLFNLS